MTDTTKGFQTIKITEVEPWPNLNPRMSFDQDELEELAESIKADGLLQPALVKETYDAARGASHFWLFAGERRLRAHKLAGLKTIDVIVRDVDEATAHRLAGVENLDRNDLTAIEEAIWLAREVELTGLTHKGLGETLGRSQAWVTNRTRLLAVPKPLQTLIHEGVVAPAMVRDTLLRFLKLDEKVQPKLWKAIVREVKRAAKKSSPVLLATLRGSVVEALRVAGAIEIREGYHYHSASNAQYRISADAFKAFKAAHPERCVQSVLTSWHGEEEGVYTFAVSEWQELIGEAQAKERATRSTGGVSKEKLEKPRLGVAKEPVDAHALRDKYGHDNVIEFNRIVDPSKIKPSSVVHVTRGDAPPRLMYVGPNVRALKGLRTRAMTPVRADVAEKVQSGRMDKGADLTASQVLTGLLEAVIDTQLFTTLHGMIEAEVGHEVDLNRYNVGTAQIAGLKIPAKSLKRIAAGIAAVAIKKERYWDIEVEVTEAIEKRVTKDSNKARKAWLDEHAPKGAK